jgi:hypothetical protein
MVARGTPASIQREPHSRRRSWKCKPSIFARPTAIFQTSLIVFRRRPTSSPKTKPSAAGECQPDQDVAARGSRARRWTWAPGDRVWSSSSMPPGRSPHEARIGSFFQAWSLRWRRLWPATVTVQLEFEGVSASCLRFIMTRQPKRLLPVGVSQISGVVHVTPYATPQP